MLPLAAVAGLACVGVAAAGSTRPGIALGHRIGAVSFGEPKAQITKALGRGVAVRLDGHRFRFYRRAAIYVAYPPKGARQVAAFVVTRSTRYRTRSGAGVGVSLRQLRSRVAVRCYGSNQCQHEPADVNRPLTVFQLGPASKRVIEVAIVPGGD